MMTCIVAVSDGKRVYMGGDSAGVSGYSLTVRSDEKVFTHSGMIFGFTSSFRMGNLLRFKLKVPSFCGDDPYEYMCTRFIDSVISCLKENNYAQIDNNSISGGQFLVGFRGRIYHIDDDFQVGMSYKNYDSIGCGMDFALGSLYSTDDMSDIDDRIRIALSAASSFSAGVSEPFTIKSVG